MSASSACTARTSATRRRSRSSSSSCQGIIGQQIYQPVGCDKCRQIGYSGRVGIYELLSIDDQMRDIIARNPNVAEFRQLCLERGMHSLRQDGMSKVAEGVTTVAEVLRVTAEH